MARSSQPNLNLAREIERSPEYRAAIGEIAADVKDSVERQSPIGETGDYIHSIVVIPRGPSARPKVATRDPFGHLVEWGSQNNPPYAPLRRGVRAAGLRLDEK